MAHRLEFRDGKATAPERPGHGVELDWSALEHLRQAWRLGPGAHSGIPSHGIISDHLALRYITQT